MRSKKKVNETFWTPQIIENKFRLNAEIEAQLRSYFPSDCESLNKHFMPVQGKTTDWDYTLIFSCLDGNDPDLKRPEEGVE